MENVEGRSFFIFNFQFSILVMEHFISVDDARGDVLACATYLAERIRSSDGHAEAIASVVPIYLAKGDVDMAAELANSVDDPFTRDRLLTQVAEKCAAIDDDEYALQLAEAVEDPGMQLQAFDRIGMQKALNGQFDKANEIASGMENPDGVYAAVAIKQAVAGNSEAVNEALQQIIFPGDAVSALLEIASNLVLDGKTEEAAGYLERAVSSAEDIEHDEERIRALCDAGSLFIDAGRSGRSVEIFDKAKRYAEALDNVHRDGFLGTVALGFLLAGSLELADRTLDLVADKTEIAKSLLGYSQEFWRREDRGEALESLEEAYAILQSQHESETRSSKAKFRLFANIAAQFAGFEKSERAIEIAQNIEDESEQTNALSQIAAILTQRKEDEHARHALRAVVDDGDRVFALIRMSDAKEKNSERDGAVELLNEASSLAETVPQLPLRSSAYSEIAKRFSEFDVRDKADEMIGRNLETIASIRDESGRAVALANLAAFFQSASIDLNERQNEYLQPLVMSAQR